MNPSKNPSSNLWFKRRLYGWGWTPATWQGWLILVGYLVIISALGFTLGPDSPPEEVTFTFTLPLILLTITLIRICYKKGESPRWQWGNPRK